MDSVDLSIVRELISKGADKKARSKLHQVLMNDPVNEEAYLLLISCTVSTDQQISYLKKVLEINPKNVSAKQKLEKLEIVQKKELREKERAKQVVAQNSTEKGPGKKSKKQKKMRKEHSEPKENEGKNVPNNSEELQTYTFSPSHVNLFNKTVLGVDYISRMETGIYGKTIIVDGVHISSFDSPVCILSDEMPDDSECEMCDFYSPENCLLRYDEFLLDDIHRMKRIKLERMEELAQKRQDIIDSIYRELKSHGRPLHYTIIAKIVIERYRKYHLKAHTVYHYLLRHPRLFERTDPGVFQAK